MRDQLDAGVDIGRDPAGPAAADPAERIEVEIALAVLGVRNRMAHDQQQRIHPLRIPRAAQFAQRVARAIEPDIVAVEAEERIGQLVGLLFSW